MDPTRPLSLQTTVKTMHPPTKDQTDIGVDNPTLDASDGAVLVLGDLIIENKDMTRQEFAKEADINYMLSRFGITPERGAPTYGEWDDNIELQTALQSVAEARTAYRDLPEELRRKFNSMEDILTAYNNGSLIINDGDVPEPPKSETQLLQERIDALQKKIDEQRPA